MRIRILKDAVGSGQDADIGRRCVAQQLELEAHDSPLFVSLTQR